MREYLVEALILNKTPSNEIDFTVDLYTKELGRIKAKITSGRKITSKLSPHLEPLTFSLVRLTEKNGFVVTDALTKNNLSYFRKHPVSFAKALKLISAIRELIYSEETDPKLWFWLKKSLLKGEIFYNQFLKIMGYDPKLAECRKCGLKFINPVRSSETASYSGNILSKEAGYGTSNGVKYFLVEDQIFLCRNCGFKVPQNKLLLEL